MKDFKMVYVYIWPLGKGGAEKESKEALAKEHERTCVCIELMLCQKVGSLTKSLAEE
jgi:hypothetical protein